MRKTVMYIWNSTPINSEASTSDKNVDLSNLCIEDAISVAYPELSFCGIHQILQALPSHVAVNLQSLYANYGYAVDSKLALLLKTIPTLPQDFISWCAKHTLSPRDLFPLLSLTSPTVLHSSLSRIHELSLSRNLGAQIIELLVECYLIFPNTSSTENLSLATTGDEWLSKLKTLRYPQTLQSDSEKQKKMMSLPWSKDFQLRWQRQGDRSGLEVRFFITDEKELKKYTQLLQQTSQQSEIQNNDAT